MKKNPKKKALDTLRAMWDATDVKKQATITFLAQIEQHVYTASQGLMLLRGAPKRLSVINAINGVTWWASVPWLQVRFVKTARESIGVVVFS